MEHDNLKMKTDNFQNRWGGGSLLKQIELIVNFQNPGDFQESIWFENLLRF